MKTYNIISDEQTGEIVGDITKEDGKVVEIRMFGIIYTDLNEVKEKFGLVVG